MFSFLKKPLWVLGLDFQPGVYSICSHIEHCDCICLCLFLYRCLCACMFSVSDHICGCRSLCVYRRPSEKNGSGLHLCELFYLKTRLE